MNVTEFRSWTDRLFARHFDIPPMVSVVDWAKANIELAEDESLQFPGGYDPELSPTATVLFEFMESSEWREFIGVKSSQIGFTLAMLVAICHKIAFNPQHIIFCLNSREEIKRIGAQRLKPMIQNCKAIAASIPDDEDKLQNLTLYLNGMAIYLVGAQSAGSLANKSVGLVIGDEVDEWPEELRGGESNALDLLRDRIKRVADAKLVVFSKPKNDNDIIWPEYLTGSRHKWFVPCPCCTKTAGEPAGYQELKWEGVRYQHCRNPKTQRWDYAQLIEDTWYECAFCQGRIDEKNKPWMLANRLLRATNDGTDDHPPMPRKMSFQTSDLYNLPHVPESSWGHLAKEFVGCTTNSHRKRFRRSRLGLPVSEAGDSGKRTLHDILALQGTFERGHVPTLPAIVVLCCDVQHAVKKWVKAAFWEDDTMRIIDYGAHATFAEVVAEARRAVTVDDWGDVPMGQRQPPIVEIGLVDEGDGHYTRTVLDFCTSKAAYRLFWPAKGRGGLQTLSMRDLVDFQKKNRHNNKPLPRYIFNDGAFKEELYDERIALNREIREAVRQGMPPPAPVLEIFAAPDAEFCAEFTTERRWTEEDEQAAKTRRKKPGVRKKLMKVGDWFTEGPNDWADAGKMCLVLWYRLRRILGREEGAEDDATEDEPEPVTD
jgi:hypothetical protein